MDRLRCLFFIKKKEDAVSSSVWTTFTRNYIFRFAKRYIREKLEEKISIRNRPRERINLGRVLNLASRKGSIQQLALAGG